MSSERLENAWRFVCGPQVKKWLAAKFSRQVLSILVLSVLICVVSAYIAGEKFFCFYDFYDQRLRGFIFSGFLSVGALLLSLKTFIVVNMKDHVYDQGWYRDRYRKRRNLSSDSEIDIKRLYAPLARLSEFLHWSIVMSVITAVAQFSVGLIPNSIVALFCVWLGFFSILLLLNSLRLIRGNILVWLGVREVSPR